MAEKRRDKKGRVLRKGEGQRKDMIYQYRYTDIHGKRVSVYDADLHELRKKEDEIQRQLSAGCDITAGKEKVAKLACRYIRLKKGLRESTMNTYSSVLKALEEDDFGNLEIGSVKVSDAKEWAIRLHDTGRGSWRIKTYWNVMRPAFQMAYDEGTIARNPFLFKLSDVIQDDSRKREALTEAQQEQWLGFIQSSMYSKYYDIIVVLLGTGMRINEFCGLTKNDIDFQNRRIHVDHQLVSRKDGSFYMEKPKTAHGCRYIPMSDDVYASLKKMVSNISRRKIEMMVEGYTGFVVTGKSNKPKDAKSLEGAIKRSVKKFRQKYPDQKIPDITPHVLRHTFCTNMEKAGMDVKVLQYIMGHANVSTTLDVYTHMDYDYVSRQMRMIDHANSKECVADAQ